VTRIRAIELVRVPRDVVALALTEANALAAAVDACERTGTDACRSALDALEEAVDEDRLAR